MPGHTYPLEVIRFSVRLVLDAACSLRGASAVWQLLNEAWTALPRTPVPNTGQSWLLRIGLFELMRAKVPADDWCWMLDHTIQLGKVKCLLIVGVRLSAFRKLDRPLEHQDLQLMALEPVEKSDGVTVCRQLQTTCEKTGIVPRLLLSDEGTDLLSGFRAFLPLHPETAVCHDIAHLAAKFVRQELEADSRWAKFIAAACSAKQRLAQTSLAHLLPPRQRDKARYMNLGPLVAWGNKTLQYLDAPHPVAGQVPDRAVLAVKLGWLCDYRGALAEWSEAMQVVQAACDYVRRQGYHAKAAQELQRQLANIRRTSVGDRLATRLLEAVTEQSAAARAGERFIGSSECLESLIGKGKHLEGQQSTSGFTKMILGLAAAVVTPTQQYLQQALSTIKTIDVRNWCLEHLGVSVQSQRRQALGVSGTKMR